MFADKSLAPQEWISLLSWCISQIENDLCIQNIWIYFLYHNSILLLFLWHSPIECNPFAWPCWGFTYKCLLSLKFQVSYHQRSQVEKGHTEQLEIRFMMYFCFCPTDIAVLNIFPRLSLHFLFKHFFVSRFLSRFWNLKLHGRSCDIILHYHYSHHF